MHANDGFRELGRQECLGLLTRVPIGRVVYTRQALPAITPVNFCLDHDGAVVILTSARSELARAADGAVVAFEADEVDSSARAGWSVVVTGKATVVTDPAENESLNGADLSSWVRSPEEVFVRIEAELVTGRQLIGGRTLYGMRLSA